MTLFRNITEEIIGNVSTTNVIANIVSDIVPEGPGPYSISVAFAYINLDNFEDIDVTIDGDLQEDDDVVVRISDSNGNVITDATTLGDVTPPLLLEEFDLTEMVDGLVTFSLIVVRDGIVGDEVSIQVLKDIVAPEGYEPVWVTEAVDAENEEAVSFMIVNGEVGASFEYTIMTSGGEAEVSDTGTIESDEHLVEDVDVSTLDDGNLSIAVVLTDVAGNEGDPEYTESAIVKDTGG